MQRGRHGLTLRRQRDPAAKEIGYRLELQSALLPERSEKGGELRIQVDLNRGFATLYNLRPSDHVVARPIRFQPPAPTHADARIRFPLLCATQADAAGVNAPAIENMVVVR